MKVNCKNNIETARFEDVAAGNVFFFVDEVYENDEGYTFDACGPFLKGELEDDDDDDDNAYTYLAVSLDYGTVIADVSFDSEVYFPKKAELNIEK